MQATTFESHQVATESAHLQHSPDTPVKAHTHLHAA